MTAKFVVFLLLTSFSGQLFAWPPEFGTEITLTDNIMTDNLDQDYYTNASWEAQGKYSNWLIDQYQNTNIDIDWIGDERFKEVVVEEVVDSLTNKVTKKKKIIYSAWRMRLEYSDGFNFFCSFDPGVLEFQSRGTLETYKSKLNEINRDIYKAGKQVGLDPHHYIGGGHLHIGAESAFKDRPELFRKFFVDFQNHPLIIFGILGHSLTNAPPILALDSEQWEKFQEVIADYDAGSDKDYTKLATEIQTKVYTRSLRDDPVKYHAINLTRMARSEPDERTMEIRSLRPQKSAEDLVLMMELFQARMEYLHSTFELPQFNPESEASRLYLDNYHKRIMDDRASSAQMVAANEIKNKDVAVGQFYRYITESGLDWERFKGMISDEWGSKSTPRKVIEYAYLNPTFPNEPKAEMSFLQKTQLNDPKDLVTIREAKEKLQSMLGNSRDLKLVVHPVLEYSDAILGDAEVKAMLKGDIVHIYFNDRGKKDYIDAVSREALEEALLNLEITKTNPDAIRGLDQTQLENFVKKVKEHKVADPKLRIQKCLMNKLLSS